MPNLGSIVENSAEPTKLKRPRKAKKPKTTKKLHIQAQKYSLVPQWRRPKGGKTGAKI